MKGDYPRSCLDILRQGYRRNTIYNLYDNHDQVYWGFCDLSSEPGSAWTLVISWVTAKYKDLPNFKNRAFNEDAPINDGNPNLENYRQTLARMNIIRGYSTHLRATCSFNPYKAISYRDYLRVKFSDFDIMGAKSATCQPVEYINILGRSGWSGTTVGFWQRPGKYLLHIDSGHRGCEFVPPSYPGIPYADYFGYYGDGANPLFTCSQNPLFSTTQWWFGGYLKQH